MPLPPAYRSLPRPSSPPCAQASPTCLRSLDYITCGATVIQAERYDLLHLLRVTICFVLQTRRRTDVPPDEIKQSLNKDSQIRDLPLLPLSNSVDAQSSTAGPRTTTSSQERIELGSGCARRATYESFQSEGRLRFPESYSPSVKEVIQPQVPLRLPCYDFAPVTALAFGRLIPCGFRHGLRALTASMA